MADVQKGDIEQQAESLVPGLDGRTQDEVRDWVWRITDLTDWNPSLLAVESGLAASTLNRFLNAPVKHNLSTTTLHKLRRAAVARLGERLAAGEVGAGPSGEPVRLDPVDAVISALGRMAELSDDRRTRNAIRKYIDADPKRRSLLGAYLTGGKRTQVADEEYVLVPVYDVAAAAGDGTIVDDDHITGRLAFKPGWLQKVTNAPPEDLAVITVKGDSMEHTLKHDDTVLVDFTQRRPKRDGIFVIRYDDAVQVKRVSIHPVSGRLTVHSDNKDYPSYGDIKPDSVDIVGRVIWLGRQV